MESSAPVLLDEREDPGRPAEVDALVVRNDWREHPVWKAPDELAASGVERECTGRSGFNMALVLVLIQPAERGVVDEPRHDRGRSCHTALRIVFPPHVPSRRVECDEVAVPCADVDRSPPNRRGRVDVCAYLSRPEQASASGSECVDRAVGIPDVDAPVRDRRGRIEVLATPEACERLTAPTLAAR